MSGGGYFMVKRGWRDNPVLKGEYSRGDAWLWLIEQAAHKPQSVRIKGQNVTIERGELSFAVRFMADKWGWSKSRVDRFLADLREESMIETRSKIGTTAGQRAGQGQSIISICNYELYQNPENYKRDNAQTESGTTAGQQRDKEEEREEGKKEEVESAGARNSYAFSGKTIRLNEQDFYLWKQSFHAIPDLSAELLAIDGWWQRDDTPDPKNWFYATSQMLNRKHQEIIAQRRNGRGGDDLGDDYLAHKIREQKQREEWQRQREEQAQ